MNKVRLLSCELPTCNWAWGIILYNNIQGNCIHTCNLGQYWKYWQGWWWLLTHVVTVMRCHVLYILLFPPFSSCFFFHYFPFLSLMLLYSVLYTYIFHAVIDHWLSTNMLTETEIIHTTRAITEMLNWWYECFIPTDHAKIRHRAHWNAEVQYCLSLCTHVATWM
jgi:hypothetical protein